MIITRLLVGVNRVGFAFATSPLETDRTHGYAFYARAGFPGGVATPLTEGTLHMLTRKLVSRKELKLVYGIPYSFQHIARLEAAGQFPQRVKLGQCRVAWVADEVQEWIDERIRRRASGAAQVTTPS